MSATPETPTDLVKPPRRFTLVEILFVIAIIAILMVLLLSEPQWVADGTRDLPVRVFVFDVDTGEPIRGANVIVTRALGVYSSSDIPAAAQQFRGLGEFTKNNPHPEQEEPQLDGLEHGETNELGLVTLQHTFYSGSSNKHPDTRVFPANCWIAVSSDHFPGLVVSLGQDPVSLGDLKRRGGFLVPIGIRRNKAPAPQ